MVVRIVLITYRKLRRYFKTTKSLFFSPIGSNKMKNTTLFCKGENIYLRPYDETLDLNMIHAGENNPSVRETLFLFSPLTKFQAKDKITEWVEKNDTIIFTICEAKTDIPIGITGLFRIDSVSRAATFYIAIYNPEFWSKGYGKEATKLVLKYSFNILNLNRIQLHVAKNNNNGINAYKKVGFVTEGILREAMYHNNEYVDFYVMSILRKEFYKE